MLTVHCRRPAMATLFEAWLVGDDPEHLSAVGEAALDEVARVERLLSRHDPAAELARVNREAAGRFVRVSPELFTVLTNALRWSAFTQGAFDVFGASPSALPLADRLSFSPGRCMVRFLDDHLSVDLGGYGKGYALDAAARVLDRFQVQSALLHGGTSSVLARGRQADGRPWRVGISDPFQPDRGQELARLDLVDQGFSMSATEGPGSAVSDILDPATGSPLEGQGGCLVLAPKALDAEVLSTALLVMGREGAISFLGEVNNQVSFQAAWIDRDTAGQTRLEWIAGGNP